VTEKSPVAYGAWPSTEIDLTVPHSPRVWNYWLGGKDNFEIMSSPDQRAPSGACASGSTPGAVLRSRS
jgi:hypothetical protein